MTVCLVGLPTKLNLRKFNFCLQRDKQQRFSLHWKYLTCCLSVECLCVRLPTLKLTIWHGQIYRSIQSHILLSPGSTLSSNYSDGKLVTSHVSFSLWLHETKLVGHDMYIFSWNIPYKAWPLIKKRFPCISGEGNILGHVCECLSISLFSL